MTSSGSQPSDSAPRSRLARALAGRVGALRHVPALIGVAWRTSRALTTASIALRLVRACLPALMLYVGKLIIDAVVAGRVEAGPAPWSDERSRHVAWLVATELGLAFASDLLGRAATFVDGVLAELTGNAMTLTLMAHAASLDLEQFEDASVQDRLERARRQVAWRSNLMGQLLGQAQDLITSVTLAMAVVAFLPWLLFLLVLALIPAFLNEIHFNRRGYRLAYQRSPERRELDYLRYLGAGAESAKEVKLFGLDGFLSERFREISARMVGENTRLALARAGWGGLFATIGTLAYYLAYLVIVWRTLEGR